MHGGQKQIKAERKRFNVVNCGRRFGKDILCIDLAIETAVQGYPMGWFQPTYKNLMEVWRAMKRILAPIIARGGINTQDKRIELITGGVIEFWSLDNDPEASRGRKYRRVIVNEAAKARGLQTAWELAIRATLMDYKGDAFFPSTPRGRDYYFELYQQGQPLSLTYDPDWASWQMPTHTNPHIDPDELALMERSMPGVVYRQEILAEFLDVAGRFFDEWEPSRKFPDLVDGEIVEREGEWHVVKPFAIPAHWRCWGAIDYGTSKNAKSWSFQLYVSDPEGGVVVIDEIYESGKLPEAQADLILQLLKKHGMAWPQDPNQPDSVWETRLDLLAMPPDAFAPDSGKEKVAHPTLGRWPAESYFERGLPVVRADNNRNAGWAEVKRWIHKVITFKDDQGEEDIRAGLRVFAGRCANLIRTLPQMIVDEKDPEDIEQDPKQEDHPSDNLRYGLMTRPRASDKDAPQQAPRMKTRADFGAIAEPEAETW